MPNWLNLKSYRVEIKFPLKISKSMRLQKDFQNVLFQIDLQNIKNWVALQVPFMVQHTTLYDSFLLLGYGLIVEAFELLRLVPHSPRIPTPKTTGPCPHQWGPVDNNLNICTGTKGVYTWITFLK